MSEDGIETTIVSLATCEICTMEVTEIVLYDQNGKEAGGVVCLPCLEAWEELSQTEQEHLIAWYNTRAEDLDATDYARLAQLHQRGEFVAYACGHCGETVRQGNPTNWHHFQGVCQDEGAGQLCADCYGLYERLKDLAGWQE